MVAWCFFLVGRYNKSLVPVCACVFIYFYFLHFYFYIWINLTHKSSLPITRVKIKWAIFKKGEFSKTRISRRFNCQMKLLMLFTVREKEIRYAPFILQIFYKKDFGRLEIMSSFRIWKQFLKYVSFTYSIPFFIFKL